MHAKRVLVVGVAKHYFNRKLYQLMRNSHHDVQFDVFNTGEPILDPSEYAFYNKVFQPQKNKFADYFGFVKGIRGIIYRSKLQSEFERCCNLQDYDYIHLQSIPKWFSEIISTISIPVITTVWGSDFYRKKKYENQRIKNILKSSTSITVATASIKNDVLKFCSDLTDVRVIKFGLEVFDEIDKLLPNLNLNSKGEVLNITIGYNSHPAQQHLMVIEQIAIVKNKIHIPIKIILPFTYGPEDEIYISNLKTALEKYELDYEFLFEFMTASEVASQCLRSDIMIQLQPTDAFSGSMQEYMYAGNLVVTGKWLNYSELKDNNVSFQEIEHIDDLGDFLVKAIAQGFDINEIRKSNRKPLYQLSSWGNNINKWYTIYHD